MGYADADALMENISAAAHAIEWATERFWRRVQRLIRAAAMTERLGIECHAGHGLNYDNVGAVAAILTVATLGVLTSAWGTGPGAEQLQALFGAFEIGWAGYLAVILIAVIVAAISGLVSRIAVRRYLAAIA